MVELGKIFDGISNASVFENRVMLQSSYKPENIPHRDRQIEQVASIMAPCLRGERISNLFVYGQTGSGKTLSVEYVKNELLKRSREQNLPLRIEYLNCKLR